MQKKGKGIESPVKRLNYEFLQRISYSISQKGHYVWIPWLE